jgi:hypothetical protein
MKASQRGAKTPGAFFEPTGEFAVTQEHGDMVRSAPLAANHQPLVPQILPYEI